MVLNELIQIYGVKTYTASAGENLYKICLSIYGSYDDRYVKILTRLNQRLDWQEVSAGAEIKYLNIKQLDVIDDKW